MSFFSKIGGAILGVGSNLLSSVFQRRNNASAFYDNANLSWQMWNAQNAYNDPAAQMSRYKAAGLNPNLIYGQSNLSPSISVPSRAPDPAPNFDFLGRMAQSQAMESADLHNSFVGAQTEAVRHSIGQKDKELAMQQQSSLDHHLLSRQQLAIGRATERLLNIQAKFYGKYGYRDTDPSVVRGVGDAIGRPLGDAYYGFKDWWRDIGGFSGLGRGMANTYRRISRSLSK